MRFNIVTLGCKVNSYESRAVSQQLISLGYKEVSCKEKAESSLHSDDTQKLFEM